MSNLYTVYLGKGVNHDNVQEYLRDCDLYYRTYYAPGVDGVRIIYDIEADLEFLSVLSLKFGMAELISTTEGVRR